MPRPTTRPHSDRNQGRRAYLAPDEKTVGGSMKLKPSHWQEFHARGGAAYLRQFLDLPAERVQSLLDFLAIERQKQ